MEDMEDDNVDDLREFLDDWFEKHGAHEYKPPDREEAGIEPFLLLYISIIAIIILIVCLLLL